MSRRLRHPAFPSRRNWTPRADLNRGRAFALPLHEKEKFYYVQNLCGVIERWNLTQYDVAEAATSTSLYRVRKSWPDAASQKGAFRELSNAKACADKNPGYSVFDGGGNVVYASASTSTNASAAFQPYTVRVSISDLNIRKGPGTNYGSRGYTGKGVFTIVEEATGKGATKWGLLKSYASKKDGWVSLDYAKKV